MMCADCRGEVRESHGTYYHTEPAGYPQLQTIARNVKPIGDET